MAITEALRLVVSADTAGAVASVEKLGGTADRELSRSERSLDRWGNRLTTVGAGMIAFGAAALTGLSSAVQSAGQLEQAVGGTEAVFGDASGVIDRYAETAAESAGLSEQAFRTATTSIGGNLKRMGFDTDEAAQKSVELTQVAADLAATYGGTTAEAVQALGAAFRGEADPAERFNLDLKVSKVNAEAVALGLASSTDAVSDNARAQALLSLVTKQSSDAQGQFGRESDTLAGKQQTLSAEFENLKASIGEGAMPVFQTFLGVAEKAVGVFKSADGATAGLVGKIAAFGSVGLVAAGGMSVVVGQAIKMRENLGALATGVQNLSGRVGGLKGVLGIGAGLAGVLFIATEALDAYNRKKAEAERLAQAYADALAKEGDAQREALDEITATDESLDGIRRTLREADADVGTFQDAIESGNDELEDMQELAGRAGQSQVVLEDALREAAAGGSELAAELLEVAENGDAYGQSTRDLIADLLKQQEAFREGEEIALDTAHATGEASGATDEMTESLDRERQEIEDTTTALEDYVSELKAMTDPLFGAMDAINGQRDAQLAYRDAQAAVLTSQQELDKAIREHGGTSTEAAEATRALEDAQRELTDAQFGTVESAAEVDSALAELQDAVKNGDVQLDEFRETLQRWVDQGFLTQEQALLAAASLGDLGEAADEADEKRVDVPVTTPGQRDARHNLAEVKDAVNNIPRSRNTHVSASGVSSTIANLDNIARRINAIDNSSFHISVGGGGGLTLHGGGFVPGPVGTEVAAVLQAGEFVVPLPDAQALGRPAPFGVAGAGPSQLAVTITDQRTTVTLDGKTIAETLARHQIDNHGRASARVR